LSDRPAWYSDALQSAAHDWTERELARLGLARREDGGDRFEPWSVVRRIATAKGNVYFKAASPAMHHEVRLTVRLAAWYPDLLVQVLAADEARGWMLLADGARTLREAPKGEKVRAWLHLLRDYAGLQIH
jgi:hypothetical protein